MTLNTHINGSLLSIPTTPINFTPQLSAYLTAGVASSSVTFTPLTGMLSQTFLITNKGDYGAYIGWGKTTATAVLSTTTPTAQCHYIGRGVTITLSFQISTGIVDTIAAIREASNNTTLEISLGYGQ